MDTFSTLLHELGLERYSAIFAENDVDLEVLRVLSERELQELGITLGHRKKLLKAIGELNGRETTAPTVRLTLAGLPPRERESIGADAERRQLTVMFCDLVGSTALAERLDPEELRDLMQDYQRACRGVIEKYDGHVAQYLDDGLMVYFGWPHAHEDDAVRAIRAGLEVTEAVAKLTVATPLRARVGIHTGLVVVGETGQGDASIPKAAVGETPNIAARLQALAEPGSVVVSEHTRSLAGGLFDCTDLGPHMLKGISEPMHLFKVMGARATESRFEASRSEAGLTPLVGREEEIALLLRRWQQSKEGEGQVVLVGGEPGIGKSRLTRVLRERLRQERYLVLRYQCSPYHLNSALYPVVEQFERAGAFNREDSPDQRLDKMQLLLVGSAEQITERAPLFASLLSLPLERYLPLNLSPQKQKEKTLEALVGQIEALAQQQPLLMLWEDIHWIDATSQEFMDLLVPRLRHLAVLVIVTYRPESTPRWTDQAHVTTLGLNRLGRRQGIELVTKLTAGKPLPPEVLEQILAHTDGVPLFIEELTKSVIESTLLRETGDGYALEVPLPALAIPTTLRDSLIARLDRLAPVREVAQIGACIGREFSYELLAAVSPLKDRPLDEALEQLTKTGLVFRRGTPPVATYTFKHALVQDAAYDSLLKSKRVQLHAQIAEALEKNFADTVANEPELLAHHFTQAGLIAKALPYWLKAGLRALASTALNEAVGHLSKALELVQTLPPSIDRDKQEVEVRLNLAAAHMARRGWASPEPYRTLDPAIGLAERLGDTQTMLVALSYQATYHLCIPSVGPARTIATRILSLGELTGNESIIVAGEVTAAVNECAAGNWAQARTHGDRALQLYDFERDSPLSRLLNGDLKSGLLVWAPHYYWALGLPERAHAASIECVAAARRVSHPFNLIWALTGGSSGLIYTGDTKRALAWNREAREVALEQGMEFLAEAPCNYWGGPALIADGQYAEGYEMATLGGHKWNASGGRLQDPILHTFRAHALGMLGRTEEGLALARDVLRFTQETDHRTWEPFTYCVLGDLLIKAQRPGNGKLEEAEAAFAEALRISRSKSAKGFELLAATGLARLWESQSKRRDGYDLLAPIYKWFTEGFETKDLRDAKALLEALSAR